MRAYSWGDHQQWMNRYRPFPASRSSDRRFRGCERPQPVAAPELWRTGTQTVFGEGEARAEVMFVGEQPGDREDIEGRPFVGPAGRLLDQALERAGIERD